MQLERTRRVVCLTVTAVLMGLLLVGLAVAQQPPAAAPQQGEAEWLPIGAQAFRFGDDGCAIVPESKGLTGTRGWAFYGPTGTCDLVVSSLRRVWLEAPADAGSLTAPPKERRLAVRLDLRFQPSGDGRWQYGRLRVEVGLVDHAGQVVARLEKQHTGAVPYSFGDGYYSPYRGSSGNSGEYLELALPLDDVPDRLPERGYIRADVVAGSPYDPFYWWSPSFRLSYGN
ncbi:MAG: hypothetical protein FJX75_18430 [Armatimonadetes bacterium]|nr:hypothetical protein [Armatimonadota bacterium]